MKKILFFILIVICIILFIIFNKPNNLNRQLKDIGYDKNEIKYIIKYVNESDIKKYLLDSKFNNLVNFLNVKYSKISNIYNYENYYLKNKTLSYEDIVTYVEIGLDKPFYTNIKTVNYKDYITILVNKYNKLNKDFKPLDLVTLSKDYSSKNEKVNKEVSLNLIKMFDEAKKEGFNLNVISGYRTNKKQEILFNNSVKNNGYEHALKYSAKPYHSEHETGLCVDINSTNENFKDTKEYQWLKENSYKYGFIERYPKDKEYITGYAYEPWHYRYVGLKHSINIYFENITYEEYYVKYLV